METLYNLHTLNTVETKSVMMPAFVLSLRSYLHLGVNVTSSLRWCYIPGVILVEAEFQCTLQGFPKREVESLYNKKDSKSALGSYSWPTIHCICANQQLERVNIMELSSQLGSRPPGPLSLKQTLNKACCWTNALTTFGNHCPWSHPNTPEIHGALLDPLWVAPQTEVSLAEAEVA